jgi:ectoine hydroxylase-related dioxygenase (phytanoyl-CoA dioxygenase family)
MSQNNWIPTPEKWLADYNESGYLVVENAVDPDTLGEMRSALERIEADFHADKIGSYLKRFISTDRDRSRSLGQENKGSAAISNIMELPLFGDVFRDIIVYPRVLDILEALFQTPEFHFHNYKCISKMPHNKTPFQWHRDLPYLQHTSPNLLTCMLCMDDMTKENGATVVCPGSHRIAHEDVKASDTNMKEEEVPDPRVTVECPAGSAVVFHVSIVHGGGPNESESKRRNVIGIWAGPDALPTTANRYAYEFVAPRSKDPIRRKQIAMTFGSK